MAPIPAATLLLLLIPRTGRAGPAPGAVSAITAGLLVRLCLGPSSSVTAVCRLLLLLLLLTLTSIGILLKRRRLAVKARHLRF